MPRRIGYLVNPAAGAGRGAARWTRLQGRLAAAGLAGEIRQSRAPGDAIALAAELGRRCDLVVAVGGDGTAMETATGLAPLGPDGAALGILPLGSGNDTARLLGTANLDSALASLAHGPIRSLDLIEVRCVGADGQPLVRLALDFAGTGLTAEVLAFTPASWKPFGRGQAAYAAGLFRALAAFHPAEAAVRVDEWSTTGQIATVLVANQAVSGGGAMQTGPGARPDDGRLNVSVIRSPGRWRMALQFVRLVRGTHIHHPAVTYREGRDIAVTAEPPVGVAADGDILGTTPARFRVLPGAMRVLTGPGATI